MNLYSVFDTLSEGVAICDLDGQLLHFNEAAIRMHGFAGPEDYLRSLPTFADTFELSGVDGMSWTVEQWPLSRVLRGEVLQSLDARVRRKNNGWERLFTYNGALLRGADGRPTLAIVTMRDVTADRQAHYSLQVSEERFRLLVEGIKDYAIIMLDPAGRVASWNEGARRLKGYSEEEILGQPMERFYSPEDIAADLPARLRARAAAEGRCEDEGWRVRKDGTRFYANLVLTAIHGGDGTLIGFAKITRDVTERRRAEHEAHEQRAFLRQVIDLNRNFIFVKDRAGRFTLVNEALAEAYGTTAENLLGKTDADFNPDPEEVEHFRRDDLEVMDTLEEKFIAEEKVTDASGRERWMQTRKRPIVRPHGIMVLGVAADITDLKRSEQRVLRQLRHLSLLDEITRAVAERQDLQSIFQVVVGTLEESLPIELGAVCLHEPASGTLRVASVGAKRVELARELLQDGGIAIEVDANGLARCLGGELVYEPDVAAVPLAFPQRLARAGLCSVVLAPLRSESRVFGVLVAARRDAQAFSSGECEFLRQLSEHVALATHHAELYEALKQAYDELRETQEAAMQQERLRALGQMASGVAHDINNALSPISLYTDSLLETERNLSERARAYLEIIQRAVGDVAQTVARMRAFYRPRESQLQLALVQLNTLLPQVVDLTRARWSDFAHSRGVTIDVATELAAEVPQIMGVESEIRDAMTNLVLNAVDAMPSGGALRLRTRSIHTERGAFVIVEVVDTGIGMDEDTRRRCLEPFFTTKGERGTGLGLAMVYGMVKRHSCEIEIDSAPGAGTTVRLIFAVPSTVLEETGRFIPALEIPTQLRILLVDDDPLLLKSLRDALEGDQHTVVAATGGAEGIALFTAASSRGERFAAVITDLGMPHVDGRRVAAAVKEASPTTPVIMLTGWGQRLVAEGEILPGVDRVLSKPPKLRDIRETLALLCSGS